jgi:hypothetical protein
MAVLANRIPGPAVFEKEENFSLNLKYNPRVSYNLKFRTMPDESSCGKRAANKFKIIQKNSKLMLFGIFAIHSPDACPMNNPASKEMFLQIQKKAEEKMADFNVSKIVGFYMSVLEHEWIIILDAENAHDIEKLCIEVGISSVSTVKIVPINTYADAVKRMTSQ